MVLLELANGLRRAGRIELSAVHVNHGLSRNAAAWEQFCMEQCKALDVQLQVARVDVDRASAVGIEAAARAARYDVFRGVDADYVALAQHADDQAETVLHQALRGTGLKGIAGMGALRPLPGGPTVCRPLLPATRAQIEAFASARNLRWVEDESNEDTAYTRNFIRHELMPVIGSRFPHYRESLGRLARHAAEADAMLADLARLDLQWDGNTATAGLLDNLPRERQRNALYHWLCWLGARPPSAEQLDSWAEQLFRPSPTDKPHRAGGHDILIVRRRNALVLEAK
jgi:tRNA(Ile)-lysidine synthase